ncbi:MocR-like pyridoxine biosynthesis transcription factor PdxR [Paenibacillus sedimenti]|uniref:PLP-dependent aminotransferase family protein n=1 Tax=Paenibacillus sedimenti TaxID=2770274 RepID=A0A926KLZ8_9BACL|nr:PLP-dependent aminotransferase family protein [Paenibacillus sedimenti]MBD0378584.1 PLP-dependent aminotransferase family protein [Paenibacillus sedimenti]
MFEILLSDLSGQPLYLQLYTQMRNHIRSGVIRNGTRLPSIRSLHQQLNISKTPIETAFQMLLSEGYIVSKSRSGIFAVNPHENWPAFRPSIDLRQQGDVQNPIPSQSIAAQDIRFDFKPAGVDNEMFPVRIWRKMINEAIENHSADISKYGDTQGEYTLRAVLADYLRKSRGVVCSPEQVIIGSGIAYSIGLIVHLLKGIGRIAHEEPGYVQVREVFALNGFHMLPIPVGEKGISLEALEASGAQAVYVTPSHQLPTGAVMPYSEREYLLEWARTADAYIIEDDYDGEFRYFGKPISSLQSLDHYGRVIYMGTFSKAFTPAIRINYTILPIQLVQRLEELQHILNAPSRVEQWAMTSLIEQGHWYRHVRKMRNTYQRKHQRLLELIESHFSNKAKITGHSAGLHIRMELKTHLPTEELLKMAAEYGVKVYDFRHSWINWVEPEYPEIYLGFAGISESAMEEGILLLKKAWARVWS